MSSYIISVALPDVHEGWFWTTMPDTPGVLRHVFRAKLIAGLMAEGWVQRTSR